MNYQNYMKEIMKQLKGYKCIMDSLATSYLEEKDKHEEELRRMQGVYTPQYIEECDKNWKPSRDYATEIDTARGQVSEVALSYIDEIKRELDGYFQVPVDSGFAATVTAIKTLGVTPNSRELELLQESAGGYWGLRLLHEIGASRSETINTAVLDGTQVKNAEREIKKPFEIEKLPDIEAVYTAFYNMKNSVDTALSGYCGKEYALKDFVFPLSDTTVKTNENLENEYGIKTEPPIRRAFDVSRMASSEKCFDENYRSYSEFLEIMGSLAETMPESKKKTVLTDSDKRLIDALIDPNYPTFAQEKAVEIAKADSRMAEILALDSRYGTAVKKALKKGKKPEKR